MSEPSQNCIFCRIVAGSMAASRVYEDDSLMAVMDIAPLRPGHVLVLTKRHYLGLGEADATTRAALLETANLIARAVEQCPELPSDGFNFVVNEGRSAQQTVPHLHMHVVPRQRADLPRLLAQILKKPLGPLAGANRERLERQAKTIANALAAASSTPSSG